MFLLFTGVSDKWWAELSGPLAECHISMGLFSTAFLSFAIKLFFFFFLEVRFCLWAEAAWTCWPPHDPSALTSDYWGTIAQHNFWFFLSQVNLKTGVPPDSNNETCTAGAGSLLVEFGILSRLLGDSTFEWVARRAVKALWNLRSNNTGLLGRVHHVPSVELICVTFGPLSFSSVLCSLLHLPSTNGSGN